MEEGFLLTQGCKRCSPSWWGRQAADSCLTETAQVATCSYLSTTRRETRREQCRLQTSRPSQESTSSLVRPCLLKVHEPVSRQLGTKCANIRTYVDHFPFKPQHLHPLSALWRVFSSNPVCFLLFISTTLEDRHYTFYFCHVCVGSSFQGCLLEDITGSLLQVYIGSHLVVQAGLKLTRQLRLSILLPQSPET